MPAILFHGNDKDYLNWLKKNFNCGWILTTGSAKKSSSKYGRLHAANCTKIRVYNKMAKPGAWTERNYQKICSTNVNDLLNWLEENRGVKKFSGTSCPVCHADNFYDDRGKRTDKKNFTKKAKPNKLKIRDEEDIKIISKALNKKRKQTHNKMTNKLDQIFIDKEIRAGNNLAYLYDALIIDYDNKGHDLLIEAKSSSSIADVRLAVGQLLDYRRHLNKKDKIGIAVLLRNKPDTNIKNFLDYLKIKLLWFDKKLIRIEGF